MCWVKRSEFSCGRTVLQYCCCLIAILTAWKKFLKIRRQKGSRRVRNDSDVMCWVKRSKFSCGRTVLQYCCCLIAILTAWKKFLKIRRQKGSRRVRNDRDVMCLPAHDVTVIIFATLKMCYQHFHSTKLLHSGYLSQIL